MISKTTATPREPVEAARAVGVSKAFGGVHALVDVDLDVRAGEVHALCGENGAGKSTLIKILSGYYAPDTGRVEIGGERLTPTVRDATAHGVSVIHQESVACLDLDAVDNIFVGRELRHASGLLLDRKSMRRETVALLARLGESIPIDQPLADLSAAQRQMIGIARALSQRCRLLVMDEPTASLSAREAETLFRIVRQLRDEGVAVLYVSHRMEEIFALADRATVLRDGRKMATRLIGEVTPDSLIEMMVGRELLPLDALDASQRDVQEPALAVKGLSLAGTFDEISFAVGKGEIVGLAGLVGAGRSDVAGAIFGVTTYDCGSVEIDGIALAKGSIAESVERGVALAPEDRQHEGLILPMSVSENLSLAVLRRLSRWGLLSRRSERELAERVAAEMQVRAARLSQPAESLSGGNQQKLVLGKWLATKPRVLILDEPTRGVDVAAKAEIHRRIVELSRGGMATLLISSELPEVLRLSDRIVVMREGRIAGELSRSEATEQNVLQLALPTGVGKRTMEGNGSLAGASKVRPRLANLLRRRETWLIGLLTLIFAIVGAVKPSFLGTANLWDIAAEASPTAIVACAVTLVVITGEIDISVGSIVGISAAVLGLCSYGSSPPLSVPAGVACALLTAGGLGCLNGLLVTWGRVPSIIATLGMLTALRGVTRLLMQGSSIDGRPDSLRDVATGALADVPNSVWVAALVAALASVTATRTSLGRRIYAVGSNVKAAPLLGVSVSIAKFVVFATSGLMAGVATILLAPKNAVIQPNLGEGLELTVVTCVVVGGTSIRGGRGNIFGTLLAVLLLSLVPTALTYIGAPPQWRLAIQGAFILVAVLADHFAHARPVRGGTP